MEGRQVLVMAVIPAITITVNPTAFTRLPRVALARGGGWEGRKGYLLNYHSYADLAEQHKIQIIFYWTPRAEVGAACSPKDFHTIKYQWK